MEWAVWARIEVGVLDVLRGRFRRTVGKTNLTARFELPVRPASSICIARIPWWKLSPPASWIRLWIAPRPSMAQSTRGEMRRGRTSAVERRTTLLLVRLRYHIETEWREGSRGSQFWPRTARCWPSRDLRKVPSGSMRSEAKLIEAKPDANIAPELQRDLCSASSTANPRTHAAT